MQSKTIPVSYLSIVDVSGASEIEGDIVNEGLVCISVNGEELATFMCTPTDLEKLALGFLYNEGIIEDMQDWLGLPSSRVDDHMDSVTHFTPR